MLNYLWKSDILMYIIIGFILIMCIKIYTETELFSL
jgi:mannose/fructose/N-acetylgalactosamine-specific phosphotransferase system component IIC